MTVSFVTCGDNPDEEKETNCSSSRRSEREGIDIISFTLLLLLFLTHKVAPSCLGLDVAPEINGSPWHPSFKEDN